MSVWGAGVGRGTDSAYSPLKVSYRRFSFPRDRPDVRWTKSANRDFFFVLHTPALSGPPPCISTSCSFFKKLGVCCPSQKNIVIYSHISLYIIHLTCSEASITRPVPTKWPSGPCKRAPTQVVYFILYHSETLSARSVI